MFCVWWGKKAYGTPTWARADEWQGQYKDYAQYGQSVSGNRTKTTRGESGSFRTALPKISLMY